MQSRFAPFVFVAIASCATGPAPSSTALLHEESPSEPTPVPSVYQFPTQGRMVQSLGERPAPPALFGDQDVAVSEWAATGELPAVPGVVGHENESPAGVLIGELTAPRPSAVATAGAGCLAREVAAIQARRGGKPGPSELQFHSARCGAVSAVVRTRGFTVEVPPRASDARVWARYADDVRSMVASSLEAVGEHRAHVGLAMARHGNRFSVALVVEAVNVLLEDVRPSPDEANAVVLRGRLLSSHRALNALITVGERGFRACEPAHGMSFPEFAFRCEMAPDDAIAGIDIVGVNPGRFLSEQVAGLLARRSPEAARQPSSPDVGESLVISDAAALPAMFVERVNELRARDGLRPLRHAEAESTAMAPAAPHFFADGATEDVRDLVGRTMAAGWEVDGLIQDAALSGASAPTRDLREWFALGMERPMVRHTLMDPDADVVAIASLVEAHGMAALVVTYDLFDERAPGYEGVSKAILDRVDAVRLAQGLPAVVEVQGDALRAEVDRVRRQGKNPEDALNAAVSGASRAWGRDVYGFIAHIGGDPSAMEVPVELLEPGPLHAQAAVIFQRAPGAPWGQYMVFLLLAR